MLINSRVFWVTEQVLKLTGCTHPAFREDQIYTFPIQAKSFQAPPPLFPQLLGNQSRL